MIGLENANTAWFKNATGEITFFIERKEGNGLWDGLYTDEQLRELHRGRNILKEPTSLHCTPKKIKYHDLIKERG